MKPRALIQFTRIQEIAASKGGRLISEVYLGSWVKLEFEDAAGRRFHCCPGHIVQGVWSPAESKNHRDPGKQLARLREIAENRGGRLISTAYKNNSTKLEFEDAAGYKFMMRPFHIFEGIWSPYEAKLVRDPAYHLEELARIAESRGGKLVSTEYHGWNVKLEFDDAAGNRFSSTPNNVKSGQWSPHEGLVSEPVCRQAVEHLLGAKFPSRWDVVRRPNGNKLQLDGYNDTLKVAFEYQGFFHGREDVQVRDADKRVACTELGILLIEVQEFRAGSGYQSDYVLEHVKSAIVDAFASSARNLPLLCRDGFVVDLSRINHCIRMREEVAALAEQRGGRLVSVEYVDSVTKLQFSDEADRLFLLSPDALKQGQWSPFASNHVQDPEHHYRELQALARQKGGRVLSGRYEASAREMEFEDVSGNIFMKTPNTIKKGSWSPFEYAHGKATRIPSPEGCRAMRLSSGATVLYDLLADGTQRIRQATDANGTTRRRWAWNRAVPVVGTSVLNAEAGTFRLVGVHDLDGNALPTRSWTSGALARGDGGGPLTEEPPAGSLVNPGP